jgi:hypothetical protein
MTGFHFLPDLVGNDPLHGSGLRLGEESYCFEEFVKVTPDVLVRGHDSAS